jgi:hypothetical protein
LRNENRANHSFPGKTDQEIREFNLNPILAPLFYQPDLSTPSLAADRMRYQHPPNEWEQKATFCLMAASIKSSAHSPPTPIFLT